MRERKGMAAPLPHLDRGLAHVGAKGQRPCSRGETLSNSTSLDVKSYDESRLRKSNRARTRYSLSRGEKANVLCRFAHRRKPEITSREHPSSGTVKTGSKGSARGSERTPISRRSLRIPSRVARWRLTLLHSNA